MRALACLLILTPAALWAGDIPLTSQVAAVTLYPQGGSVIREAAFSAPAGQHRLILADLPDSTPLASVRVSVDGAAMGGVALRNDYVPPRDDETDAALDAARAQVEQLEEALRTGEAGVARIELEQQAAQSRVAFLEQLGQGDSVAGMDAAALRDLAMMIGQETLAARQAGLDAGLRADAADRALADLRDDLAKAREALRALVPQDTPRAMLAVSVDADTATEGRVTVSYTIDRAGWQPVYDLKLARAGGDLSIARGAFIHQSTGENWRDVALSLSTLRPSEQTSPGEIRPWLRRIHDPEAIRPKTLMRGAADGAAEGAAPMAEAAPMVQQAEARFDGLSVSYDYPGRVSVASGADRLRIALGTLDMTAETVARAVPLMDDRAFLMAAFTNDSDEVILPTGEARFYLDGRFTGQRAIGLIPAGGEAELSFGPIDGLRLSRIVEQRSEGDRGVITRSNGQTERVRIEVENLTGESWPVRLLDRVPYSEQDALEIDWSASPAPDTTDAEDKRGVLGWSFDLAAGQGREITLDYSLQWPRDKVLR
ncbi:MAG: DUF4139 domain-containing protein [Pseudomonadota bacterium]|uniref:DUF4139 domain-containing protein n=1 Tax=Roseovarius TaxID=74030 RepID=UPI0022A83E18|nr:DUF4139 domain-containing protein [Roseovarius sp. EGI FJ00037]MCZ0813725.1 DUF4139 domain-containing protein [Roseovarius sp. EGI FJ00037]